MLDEAQYLKTKREFQGLQGSAINDAYYSDRETTLSAIETIYIQNRWKQDFSSPTFGSSAQFILSSDDLIGGTYLHLVLTEGATGVKLPFGWGLAAINSITYQFPGSNIGRITLSQTEIYHLLMGQNQDYTTTTAMLLLAGQTSDGTKALSVANNSADVLLPLPFSSMDPEVKPFDSHLFKNGAIIITVSLSAGVKFIKDAGNYTNGFGGAFKKITLSFRQGSFSNLGFSLRSKLDANPQLAYSYPFIRTDFRSDVIKSVNQTTTAKNAIYITGFLDFDLVGIIITVHLNSKVNPTDQTKLEPYTLANITDVELTYGSQVMFSADGLSYRLYGFQSVHSSGYDSAGLKSVPNTLEPIANFPVFIDFSQKRQCAFSDHYYNTRRFGGKTMVLSFLPGFDQNGDLIATDTELLYRITLCYNSVIEISAGSSNMYGV